MTNIYFVRHGESEYNVIRKFQGQINSNLTEKGKKQADLLAERFENIDVDAIYSSDLDRAYITASKIADKKGLEVEVKPDLKEMSFGIWEGMLFEEVMDVYKEDFEKWLREPEKMRIPEGETLYELRDRMRAVVDEIIKENQGKTIVIVSHGTSLKSVILDLLSMEQDFYKNLTMGNTAISKIEIRDYNNVLAMFNDNNHLEALNNGK